MKSNRLSKIKASHAVKYNADFPKRNLTGLEVCANVDDVKLKKAGLNTLEGYASALVKLSERAEQERIKANPPVTDRAYVERADYPITSLYSDYKEGIEAGHHTWADYKAERRKWRRCVYKYCLNMMPIDADNFRGKRAKRKDSRFCCITCKVGHSDAEKRFKKTGSYLPQWFYLPAMSETIDDRVRTTEFASEMEAIETEINKKRPVMKVPNIDDTPEIYEVETYNLADLSIEEIKAKNLGKNFRKFLEKKARDVG